MKKTGVVTHEELLSLFSYEPSTGQFVAKARRANHMRSGSVAGHVNKKGYRIIKIRSKAYKAHRLAIFYSTGEWPADQVDHINGERDDNRLENLRCADSFLNAQNHRKAPKHSTTGLFGAHKGGWKGRRWVSEIRYNGVRHYLGVFDTPEEASAAYLQAKRRLHSGCTI